MSQIAVGDRVLCTHTERLMGNRFDISVYATDQQTGAAHIVAAVAEIKRIEALLTTFSDNSETAKINHNAGIKPIEVSSEMFGLITRASKISAMTQGAFDLTYGSLDKRFWNFDTQMTALPDPVVAQQSVHLINWQNLVMDAENQPFS